MNEIDIIEMYKKGKSIAFITNQHYREKNANIPQNYYKNGSFIITKKEVNKTECRKIVETVIINYLNRFKVING